MSAIHIHEDDWGMRRLHPIEALPEAREDLAEAAAARERNRAPDGIGWSDVHVIRAPATDYAALGLTLENAAAALEPLLPRVRNFNATATSGFSAHDPMGSYETDAYAFGFDETCFVKLDAKDNLAARIWFECRTGNGDHRNALRNALLAIDALVPSAVADYWLEVGGALRDGAFLDLYFRALAED